MPDNGKTIINSVLNPLIFNKILSGWKQLIFLSIILPSGNYNSDKDSMKLPIVFPYLV